jgi:hypothetical protein
VTVTIIATTTETKTASAIAVVIAAIVTTMTATTIAAMTTTTVSIVIATMIVTATMAIGRGATGPRRCRETEIGTPTAHRGIGVNRTISINGPPPLTCKTRRRRTVTGLARNDGLSRFADGTARAAPAAQAGRMT